MNSKYNLRNTIDNHMKPDQKVIEDVLTHLISSESNRFKPTQEDCQMLQKCGVQLNSLSFEEWVKFIKPLENFLFAENARGGSQKKDDLILRVRAIVDLIVQTPSIKHFRFLDGHGRTLYLFLKFMLELDPGRLATLTIEAVDIDPNVCNWHQAFYPANVINTKGNIYSLESSPEILVYFNFCGIGGEEGIADYILQISCILNYHHVFFSMSARIKFPKSYVNAKSYIQQRFMLELGDLYDVSNITPHKGFLSYHFERRDDINRNMKMELYLKALRQMPLKALKIEVAKYNLPVKTYTNKYRNTEDIRRDIMDYVTNFGI